MGWRDQLSRAVFGDQSPEAQAERAARKEREARQAAAARERREEERAWEARFVEAAMTPIGDGWTAPIPGGRAQQEALEKALQERFERENIGPVYYGHASFAPDEWTIFVYTDPLIADRKVAPFPVASCTTTFAIGEHLSVGWTLAIDDSTAMRFAVQRGLINPREPRLVAFGQVALQITQDAVLEFSRRAGRPASGEPLPPSGELGSLI